MRIKSASPTVHNMKTQPNEANDPVPESWACSTPRKFIIRASRASWSLEDNRGEVGGLFTTLNAALEFGESEQRRAGGSIRVVLPSEERRESVTHAA